MRPKVTVYHYRYLPYSETFIHRQMQGLCRHFDLKILTYLIENQNEFSGFTPVLIPHHTRMNILTGREKRCFLRNIRGSSLFHVNFGNNAVDVQQHASQAGVPMTVFFHGVDASAWLRDRNYLRKLKESKFAAVFVNSEDMKRRLLPFLPAGAKCHAVYIGIPLERFPFKERTGLPHDAFFLQIARFVPKKGIDITLRAFRLYLRDFPKSALLLAGDGPLKEDLKKLAVSLGIEKSVRFLGRITNTECAKLLSTANAFIQPSLTAANGDMEGIPTALCEAMASGLPVISTRHSGIPELIDDCKDGLLANEGDVEGVYSKMKLLKDMNIREISRNARSKIEEKFDHAKTIDFFCKKMADIVAGDR
jgi:colanic acid/amylovoran biosynthesis glycosyltransferase